MAAQPPEEKMSGRENKERIVGGRVATPNRKQRLAARLPLIFFWVATNPLFSSRSAAGGGGAGGGGGGGGGGRSLPPPFSLSSPRVAHKFFPPLSSLGVDMQPPTVGHILSSPRGCRAATHLLQWLCSHSHPHPSHKDRDNVLFFTL
jgi:hypothetical protein